MSADSIDVADEVISRLLQLGFSIDLEVEGNDDVMTALKQVTFVRTADEPKHPFNGSELATVFEIARRALDENGIEYYESELSRDLSELAEKLAQPTQGDAAQPTWAAIQELERLHKMAKDDDDDDAFDLFYQEHVANGE